LPATVSKEYFIISTDEQCLGLIDYAGVKLRPAVRIANMEFIIRIS